VRGGAAILDLGAEASSFFRPGVKAVPAEEQLRRLGPVVEGLAAEVVLSIDTRSAEVAREMLGRGAMIINDISAGTHDAGMLRAVAERKAGVILMHIGATYPENPREDDRDIVGTVRDYLAGRVEAAVAAGIGPEKIAVDPGLGFGKTAGDNWRLGFLANEIQAALGVPVVLGASRKRFLETVPPAELMEPTRWRELLAQHSRAGGSHPRDPATAAVTELALRRGLYLHRVHRVHRAE